MEKPLYIEVAINIKVTEVPIHLFLVTTLKVLLKYKEKMQHMHTKSFISPVSFIKYCHRSFS